MYCQHCGEETHDEDKFCPNCGGSLDGGEESLPRTDTETKEPPQPAPAPPDQESKADDGGINITLGKIIGYPVGLFLLVLGLGWLIIGGLVSGILFLVAGLIALPIFRTALKNKQGVSLGRWATVVIVLALVTSGALMVDNSGTNDVASNPGGGTSDLIDAPPESLLPTIDDYESGWSRFDGEDGPPRESGFFNTGGTTVEFNVTIHDTVEEAQNDLENRKPESVATESVFIGDQGFLLQRGPEYIAIQFRIANVVGETTYLYDERSVLTPGTNAKGQAEKFADAIRSQQ